MLFFFFVEPDDSLGDLARQVAPHVKGLQTEFKSGLPEQIQSGTGVPVQVDDLEKAGIEAGNESANCGGFSGADFAGQQAGATMIHKKLKASFNLSRCLGGKQLFGVGGIAEG